jgi:hypothetical protein
MGINKDIKINVKGGRRANLMIMLWQSATCQIENGYPNQG